MVTFRRRPGASSQREELAAVAPDDQAAEPVESVASARVDADPERPGELLARAGQLGMIPAAAAILEIDRIGAVGLEIADSAEMGERDPHLRGRIGTGRRRGERGGRKRGGDEREEGFLHGGNRLGTARLNRR